MKKALMLFAVFTLGLWAADFWQSKSFTDWNEKEVQKILQNSPWAKQTSVSMPGGGAANPQGGRGNRGAGGGMSGGSDPGGFGTGGAAGPASGNGNGGGLGRYAGSNGDPGDAGGGTTAVPIVVRWQSSLPVRQAIVKAKYGSEAGTSPEAKKAIETPYDHYILAVVGVPQTVLRGAGDQLKQQAALAVKGKDPIKASDFKLEQNNGTTELLFAFPKTAPFTEEDKEVEFELKIGALNIRQKFRLKDMMFNGKLEL